MALGDPTAVDDTVPGWEAGVPTQREVCSSVLSLSLPDFRQDINIGPSPPDELYSRTMNPNKTFLP